MNKASGLPLELAEKLSYFLAQGKTGKIVLDIIDGRMLSWKITEYGRLGGTSTEPLDNRVRSLINS